MKVYIDDIRPAPDGWQQARTVTDAIRFISQFAGEIDEISIDHDISYAVEVAGTQRPFPSPENFSAVARYICAKLYSCEVKLTVHSANPVGAKEIQEIFREAKMESEYKPASRVNRLESEV